MDSQLDEEAFVSRFKRTGGALDLLSSSTVTSDVLGGVPGKRLRPSMLSAARDDVVAIRRDGTFFAVVAHAVSGSLADADAAAIKAAFRLLD
jgi:hypothetical protein